MTIVRNSHLSLELTHSPIILPHLPHLAPIMRPEDFNMSEYSLPSTYQSSLRSQDSLPEKFHERTDSQADLVNPEPVQQRQDNPYIQPSIPDGGLRAWLQVLAGHLVLFNSWGYINSFGIFQDYYVQTLNQSDSNVSLVGSVQLFLLFFIGTFSGRAVDAGYTRHVITAGLSLQIIGIFTTAQAKSFGALFVTQGLIQGVGDGLLFCPMIALVASYFKKRRALAMSLKASGSATGGLVFPAIAQNLLNKVGFTWTLRVMGFVVIFNAILILLLIRPRNFTKKSGPLVDFKSFKEAPYTLYAVGSFLALWGNNIAYYYVSPAERLRM